MGPEVARGLKVSLCLVATYLFWGGTFLALRYAVQEVPPLLTIAVRCTGGALLLFAWLALLGRLERASSRQWTGALASGALLFLGCHGLLAWSEQRVASGVAALYMAAIPLWLVLLTALLERRAPGSRVWLALAVGTAGVAVLTGAAGEGTGTMLDRGALLAGGAFWALGSVAGQRGVPPTSVVQATAMQLAAGGVVVGAGAVAMGEPWLWDPGALTPRGASSLLFLVVCGTALGLVAYTWLLRETAPSLAGSYAYVNPLVAVALGWAVGDGDTSPRVFLAAPLIVLAVVLGRQKPGSNRLVPKYHDGSAPRGRSDRPMLMAHPQPEPDRKTREPSCQ